MKVTGIVVILVGIVVVYIGITGSQHRIMDIIKGIHLSGSGSSGNQQSSATTRSKVVAPTNGNTGQTGGGTLA